MSLSGYEFEVLGTLRAGTVVLGRLRDSGSTMQDRHVLIALTEDLEGAERDKSLRSARESAHDFIPLQGVQALSLKATFSALAKDAIKGTIIYPEYAAETMQLVIEETSNPLVVIDAQNRESFWACLRAMDIQSRDLLSLAELPRLKLEGKQSTAKKPITEAHLLCGDVFRTSDETLHGKKKRYIDDLRSAQKIVLPDVNFLHQVLLADFRRDLRISEGEYDSAMSHAVFAGARFMATMAPKVRALFRRSAENIFPVKIDEIVGKLGMRRSLSNQDRNDIFVPEFAEGEKAYLAVGEDKEKILKERFLSEGIDIDAIADIEPLVSHQEDVFRQICFRDGYHFLPYSPCLFQFDIFVEKNEKGIEGKNGFRVQALFSPDVEDANRIVVDIFGKSIKPGVDEKSTPYSKFNEQFIVKLKDGRVDGFAVFDPDTGVEKSLSNMSVDFRTLALANSLSAIARMHEPDFVRHEVKPETRGVLVDSAKGKYPYFSAIHVDAFTPAQEYRSLREGIMEGGTRLHKVRGHLRRHRDPETGEILSVSLVRPHERGNPERGAVSRTLRHDN